MYTKILLSSKRKILLIHTPTWVNQLHATKWNKKKIERLHNVERKVDYSGASQDNFGDWWNSSTS